MGSGKEEKEGQYKGEQRGRINVKYSMSNKVYPSNLSEEEWQYLALLLPAYGEGGRPRKYSWREILNGIFYVVRTGCQWRMLPLGYPKWQLVYYYFNRWKHSGVIERIQRSLVKQTRKSKGRQTQPTVGIIDAQSVKSTLISSKSNTGFDGGKRIKGIKRHISVDTLGLLLSVVVHAASKGDRKGAELVLSKL